MKNYPNKIISVKDSVFMPMCEVLELIPIDGISCVELYEQLAKRLCVEDFVEAMTNLYAICSIDIDNNIVYRVC